MGAWIEIKINGKVAFTVIVAPLVGAWIEMMNMLEEKKMEQVAPLVGAWIEIGRDGDIPGDQPSLPSWERGLKYINPL